MSCTSTYDASSLLLDEWVNLRKTLEISETPHYDVVAYFSKKPKVKIYTDPYDDTTWPTPWELIVENTYCPFNIILGICYTLQLTKRFNSISPEIHIAFDINQKTVYYLLQVENLLFGQEFENWQHISDLSKDLLIQKTYKIKKL